MVVPCVVAGILIRWKPCDNAGCVTVRGEEDSGGQARCAGGIDSTIDVHVLAHRHAVAGEVGSLNHQIIGNQLTRDAVARGEGRIEIHTIIVDVGATDSLVEAADDRRIGPIAHAILAVMPVVSVASAVAIAARGPLILIHSSGNGASQRNK